jgi:hypothetical protein
VEKVHDDAMAALVHPPVKQKLEEISASEDRSASRAALATTSAARPVYLR